MSRAKNLLGVAAGGLITLSAAAHSLLGWRSLGAELAKLAPPPDLARALRVGWHFGGFAMLAFGLVAISLFSARLRGRNVPGTPVLLIGFTYVGFGLWALMVSGFAPFFLLFLVPGLALVVAGW